MNSIQLVEKHVIKRGHKFYKECDSLCWLSKNLYNKANYIVRQSFIGKDGKYLNFYDMNRIMIDADDVDYRNLPTKVSNGTLRLLDKNWKSFFKSIKDYVKNPNKYLGRPKLPKYKNTKTGRFVVHYVKGAISRKFLKEGVISLSKTDIKLNTKITLENIQAVRIVPKFGSYVIEVIYNKEIAKTELDNQHILGIDLGINNLMTCSTTKGKSFIINGKPVKSINQYYNKRKAKLQSELKENQFTTKRIERLTNKRNNKIDDYMHKSTRYIINYCLTNKVGKIIIGNNKGWKNLVNMGKINNQKFVNIPFSKIISILEYKCRLENIEFIVTEESYTSKCSFLDNEPIKKQEMYLGKRVKRGLFRSSKGILINADVNGSLNIIRKVVPKFNYEGIEGFAVNPIRITC